MLLSSFAFENEKPIPTKYAYYGIPGGKNLSPPLAWSKAPENTKSFALSIIDIHPIANLWVHWIAINIPSDIFSLPEGASNKNMPGGSQELYNSYGTAGYGGPQPPRGSGIHTYEIVLYALNVEKLDLSVNSSLSGFQKAIDDKIISAAKLTGIYER